MRTAHKIRQVRESRNVTQEYMAAKLRISKTTYGNIERNTIKRLTLSMVMAIAGALNVHYTELLGEEIKNDSTPVSESKRIQALQKQLQQALLKMGEIEKQLQQLRPRP